MNTWCRWTIVCCLFALILSALACGDDDDDDSGGDDDAADDDAILDDDSGDDDSGDDDTVDDDTTDDDTADDDTVDDDTTDDDTVDDDTTDDDTTDDDTADDDTTDDDSVDDDTADDDTMEVGFDIEIPSGDGSPTATGLEVEAGQTVFVMALGAVVLGAGADEVGPSGTGMECTSCTLPTAPRGALIGMIDTTKDYFYVGSGRTITAAATGELKLLVNDDNYTDNSGSFRARALQITDDLAPAPDDTTAVFVAKTGNDANPGTMASPKLTIQAGVDEAESAGKVVCLAAGIYNEDVDTTVSIFGGYEATNWTHNFVVNETVIMPVSNGGFTVTGGLDEEVVIEGLRIHGVDASNIGAQISAVEVSAGRVLFNQDEIYAGTASNSGSFSYALRIGESGIDAAYVTLTNTYAHGGEANVGTHGVHFATAGVLAMAKDNIYGGDTVELTSGGDTYGVFSYADYNFIVDNNIDGGTSNGEQYETSLQLWNGNSSESYAVQVVVGNTLNASIVTAESATVDLGENTVTVGGATSYLGEIYVEAYDRARIWDNQLTGEPSYSGITNLVTICGGGFYHVSGNTVANHDANSVGLFLQYPAGADVVNNTILSDGAGRNDAIWILGGSDVNIINNLILCPTNTSGANFGINVLSITGLVVLHNTVVVEGESTNSDAAAVLVLNTAATIINNILFGPFALQVGGVGTAAVYNNDLYFSAKACLVSDRDDACVTNISDVNACAWDGCSAAEDNINSPPQFAGVGDYHLAGTSLCVNAASDPGSIYVGPLDDTDFEGDVRPSLGARDIGMDEYVSE